MVLSIRRCTLLMIGILCVTYVVAQELHDGKLSQSHTEINQSEQAGAKITNDYIGLYQKYISQARGSECPMYPSCSNYGLKAFNDKPFFEAMLYTADRMLRCGHDKKYYDIAVQYGEKSLLDWPSYQQTPKELYYRGSITLRAGVLKNEKEEFSFINYLINHKQYEMALLEINRAFYFHLGYNEYLYRNKLLCYEALGREEDGIFDYEINFPDSIQKKYSIAVKAAKLYYNIDNYDMALSTLQVTNNETYDEKYQKMIFQSILQTKRKEYISAITILNQAKNEFPENEDLINENIQLINQIKNSSLKSPAVARILSIIPGAGYAYTKHYQTAVTSFLINAVLAYATYSCIKKENYGMACLTGIFSLTFYFGNIMGGGKSAHRYNNSFVNNRINRLTEINGLSYY